MGPSDADPAAFFLNFCYGSINAILFYVPNLELVKGMPDKAQDNSKMKAFFATLKKVIWFGQKKKNTSLRRNCLLP